MSIPSTTTARRKPTNQNRTQIGTRIGIRIAYYLLYFSGLTILVAMGWWQLQRGLEKSALAEQLARPQTPAVICARPASWQPLQYRELSLCGRWQTARSFLLDNRIHNGRLGYEVFSPFELTDATLLVNRGWVDKMTVLDGRFDVHLPDTMTTISGQLARPQRGFTLGTAYIPPIQWPLVIQYLDYAVLTELSEVALTRAVLVLPSTADARLTRIWQPFVVTAARHYAYCVQWWGLAVVMLIFGYIWRRPPRANGDLNENPIESK